MSDDKLFIITDNDRCFMRMAYDLACENVNCGGGPCGAVIVKDSEVIAAAGDSVTLDNDATAHAVINAIRRACSLLHDFKLEGCVVYCSCEPCPMCMSALDCARVSRVYYCNIAADAASANTADAVIYKEIVSPDLERSLPCVGIDDDTAIEALELWNAKEDKTTY